MTRHDATEVQPDAGEIVVGRITNAGGYDLRYAIRYDQPEPVRPTWGDVWQALAGFVVLGLCFVGVWLWMVILAGPNGPGSVVR